MADRNANILVSLRSPATPELRQLIAANLQLISSLQQSGRSLNQAEQQMLGLAQAAARTQKANGDLAGSERTLTAALVAASTESRALYGAQTQLANIQRGGATQAAQFGDALKNGLIGVVGPAAIATAAIGTVKAGIDSFVEAFQFKAQLDATNASIAISLRGIRDVGKTMQEASVFADRYKLTQEETAAAIQASIPILRTSNASLTDVESVLLRLQAKKPEKSIADAARALDELKAGQIVSIVDQFNVSRDAANKMKNEIAAGGDAVKILSDYLATAGFGMDALETRTKGAMGALNDYKKAQEELTLAQGQFAQGPGLAILEERITLTRGATRALTGDTQAMGQSFQTAGNSGSVAFQVLDNIMGGTLTSALALQNQATAHAAVQAQQAAATRQAAAAFDSYRTAALAATDGINQLAQAEAQAQQLALSTGGAFNAYAQAVNAGGIAAQEAGAKVNFFAQAADISAQKSALDAAAKDAQQAKTALVSAETDKAAKAFIGLNPTMGASQAFAAAVAQGLGVVTAQVIAFRIEASRAKQELAGLATPTDPNAALKAGLSALRSGSTITASEISDANVRVLQRDAAARAQAKRDAGALLDSEIAIARAKKNTAKEIDLLRQKQSQFTKGTAEYNNIEAQIIGIQTSGGKARVSAAQTTALQLQNVEENSGLQLARIQRETLERLRDQQEDFDISRSRKQEDEDRKIQSLLAHGQRGQAAREREDFARQQRRDQEDFDRQRRRTLRDSAEQTGDIGSRTDLRTQQIQERAALRGTRPSTALPGATAAAGSLPLPAARAATPQPIAQLTIQGVVNLDSAAVGTALWPVLEVRIDNELAVSLQQVGIPGAGQNAVGGAG